MSDKAYGFFMTLGLLLLILGMMLYVADYGFWVSFVVVILGLLAIFLPNERPKKRYRM